MISVPPIISYAGFLVYDQGFKSKLLESGSRSKSALTRAFIRIISKFLIS